VVGVLFILFRQIERWLHQHIFKVGWLLSHNYETTTTLYYTIFLPGVLLHEVIYWLMAGVLNVRADRAIQWPEKQEIGNLQLNFIKLSPKANPLKKAVIAATPLIGGLLAIWIIAVNIFQLESVMAIAASGSLEDIASAIGSLTSTPDFWLWFYISFTIANTMFPTISKDMKGWWQIGGALAVILVALFILGIGQNLLSDLTLSMGQILNSLSLILILTITINVTMVILLGGIESAIERITGHSATFQKGKMITMTREEALKLKQEEQEKRLTTRSTSRRRTALATPSSIYAIKFPIPGPPGQEPITKGIAAVLGMEKTDKLPDISEEDEVFETTAIDSTRQRMLKLFDDGKTQETDAKSIASDMPALPSSAPKPAEKTPARKTDVIKPKTEFDVQTFGKPKSPTDAPHIDNDKSVKRATAKLDSDEKSPDVKDTKNDKDLVSDQAKISTPQTPIDFTKPEDIKKSDLKKDIKASPEIPTSSTASAKINLSPTPTKKSNAGDDSDEDDEQLSTRLPRKSSIFDDLAKADTKTDEKETDSPVAPTWRNKTTTPPITPKTSDSDGDEEQLSTKLPRKSSIFDDLAKPTPSKALDTDNDDAIDKPTLTTSEFSRPFVKRDVLENDEEEDTDKESVIAPSSQFERPFAPPKKSDPTPSWRSQLTSTSNTEDDNEDDEQLSTRLPRKSSMFDSLNKPSTDSKDKDTSAPTSSWRSQFASNTEDEDEDDEQLSTRLPRKSSIFDSLNKPSAGSNSKGKSDPTPSWRSQLASSVEEDDEDDEDEQLPRKGSVLKGLGRPQSQQPRSTIRGSGSRPVPKPKSTPNSSNQPASDWRSQLMSDDEDENDDELNYEPIDDEFIYGDDEDDYYNDFDED
jgi:hypothetical protein